MLRCIAVSNYNEKEAGIVVGSNGAITRVAKYFFTIFFVILDMDANIIHSV